MQTSANYSVVEKLRIDIEKWMIRKFACATSQKYTVHAAAKPAELRSCQSPLKSELDSELESHAEVRPAWVTRSAA